MESESELKIGARRLFLKTGMLFALLMPIVAVANGLTRPAALEPDIAFWRRIFAEVSTSQALVHDNRHLNIVYERIEVPVDAAPSERRRITEQALERYRKILGTLANGKRTGLTSEEQRVLSLWPANVSNSELREAATRLRTQMGLSDRFLAGLKRSGAWRAHIESQLAAKGVPRELVALPHVESSYNPDSNSHVGAAGLWQFMRSTGQQFMEIDHVVDERRDPFRSSEAAAQLLAYNYSVLRSWPLAITAYNHGLGGMRRAVKQMGTEDIAVINRKYTAPTFGFASRNFYVSFLAALEVEQNAEKYFGPVQLEAPRDDLVVESPGYIPAAEFARALGVSQDTLRSFNPALLSPVWDGTKHIPRGYPVRVPVALVDVTQAQVLAALPSGQRYARQVPDAYHTIGRGESLSVIAARYDTSVRELVALNGLASQHRIRAGQRLRLPGAGAASPSQGAIIASGAETYTVRTGDSLSRIASRSGVSEAELMSRNGLRNKNHIKVGQVLYLRPGEPAEEQAAAAVSAAQPADAVAAPSVAQAQTPAVTPVAEAQAAEMSTAAAPEAVITPTAVLEAVTDPEATPAVSDEAESDEQKELAGISPARAEFAANSSLADPNDYTVAPDGSIEIQASETLGHYADWLAVKTQKLRTLNGLGNSAELVVGRRIKLDFSHVSKARFEAQRIAHHREIQEAFFIRYRVTATTEHKLQAGESVWQVVQAYNNVPVWLLRQYNPDLDFSRVKPGMSIVVPTVQPVARGASNAQLRTRSG